jgi:hypothetical protein
MQAQLQSIYNELTSFISNKNAGHINNAVALVDQNIYPLMWVFAARDDDTKQAANGSASAVALDTLNSETSTSFAILTAQREDQKTQIAKLSQAVAEQFVKLEGMVTIIATQKADAASVVATVNQAYTKEETERLTSFNTTVKGMEEKFKLFQDKTEDAASGVLIALEKSKVDAAALVEVAGVTVVTGNYQTNATKEGNTANLWRYITVGIFGVGAALACFTFYKFYTEPFSQDSAVSVLIRLLYAIVITTPAIYTAKESARHRTNSDQARQTELELASIGPFIELMPEDKKVAIREELTKKYFGNQIAAHEVEAPFGPRDVKDLAIEVVKAARK